MYKLIPIPSTPFDIEAANFCIVFFSIIWIVFEGLQILANLDKKVNFILISFRIFCPPLVIYIIFKFFLWLELNF